MKRQDQDLLFSNNNEYLRWEFRRVQLRVRTYMAARESGDVEALQALVEIQNSERLEGIKQRKKLASEGADIVFDLLPQRYDLLPVDEDVLFIVLAMHLSANTRQLLLHAQGSPGVHYLEVGFVSELLDPTHTLVSFRAWADADARLIRHGLLQVRAPLGSHQSSRLGYSLSAPHFLAAAVSGEICIDEQLDGLATLEQKHVQLSELILATETLRQLDRFIDSFRGSPERWRVLVVGDQHSAKHRLTEALASVRGGPLFTLYCDRLVVGSDTAEQLRLAERNASFFNATLCLVEPQALVGRPDIKSKLKAILERFSGLVLLESTSAKEMDVEFSAQIHAVIEMGHPDLETQSLLWESALSANSRVDRSIDFSTLVNTYDLESGQISAAVSWAGRRAMAQGRKGALTQQDLEIGASHQMRSHLGKLAEARQSRLKMKHLILEEDCQEKVSAFLEACRNRNRLLGEWGFGRRLPTGKGLVALFHGEPGTGKTLCAEVLANELELELYIVSLPDIVSKWVGETEKNIRHVFSEARSRKSMLLFDEADALFGKRVKVERSQDHFQNMEINNLLQEIERYTGIVILTTNLTANMDAAFARRILYKIEFQTPEQAQRAAIWRSLIPPEVPLEKGVDFKRLSETFELSGGQIKNAILRGAYDCLGKNTPLTYDALCLAAHHEIASAGKLTRRRV